MPNWRNAVTLTLRCCPSSQATLCLNTASRCASSMRSAVTMAVSGLMTMPSRPLKSTAMKSKLADILFAIFLGLAGATILFYSL